MLRYLLGSILESTPRRGRGKRQDWQRVKLNCGIGLMRILAGPGDGLRLKWAIRIMSLHQDKMPSK